MEFEFGGNFEKLINPEKNWQRKYPWKTNYCKKIYPVSNLEKQNILPGIYACYFNVRVFMLVQPLT